MKRRSFLRSMFVATAVIATELKMSRNSLAVESVEKPKCIESQEWAYVVDNGGHGWNGQVELWAAEIQSQSDQQGLGWVVGKS